MDTATETGTEVMATGRDSSKVMGMMILANEGTSLRATSGLLGGSPRVQHLTSALFSSLGQGVRHAISVP